MSGWAEMHDSLRKEREALYGTHSRQRRDMMAEIREHRMKEEEEEKQRKANKKEQSDKEEKEEYNKKDIDEKENIVNEKEVKEVSDTDNIGEKIPRGGILWFIIICLIIFIICLLSN